MRISHRTVTRVIAGSLVVLGISAPLVVGLLFGTGPGYRAIPFTGVGMLAAAAAVVVVRTRERAEERVALDHARLLVEELYGRARDRSPLSRMTSPADVVLWRGRTVLSDPFSARDCATVLTCWLDEGWVEVIADPDLSETSARQLLGDPSRWGARFGATDAALRLTDKGADRPWRELVRSGEAALVAEKQSAGASGG